MILRYLYLHGFASSADSKKGTHLARAFASEGLDLQLLDLNVPSFGELSPKTVLDLVDRASGTGEVTLLGSSLGGWLASVWASSHAPRVRGLVLLCPAFDLASRWPARLGPRAFARWEQEGWLPFEDVRGVPTPLHWRFVEEGLQLPPWPRVSCPALVVHGLRDDVVPIANSERWVGDHPDARIVAVDDDHALGASLDVIAREALAFVPR